MDNSNNMSREDLDAIGMMAVMAAKELGTIDKQYTDRSKVPACRIVPKDVYRNARKQHVDPAQNLVTEDTIQKIVPDAPVAPISIPATPYSLPLNIPTIEKVAEVPTTPIPQTDPRQLELPLPGINVEMTKLEQRLFEFMNTVESELKTIRATVLIKNTEKNNESKETTCKCANTKESRALNGKGEKFSSATTTAGTSNRFPDA